MLKKEIDFRVVLSIITANIAYYLDLIDFCVSMDAARHSWDVRMILSDGVAEEEVAHAPLYYRRMH